MVFMLTQTRCMLGCRSRVSGMLLNAWFQGAALQPDSGIVFSSQLRVWSENDYLLLHSSASLLCPGLELVCEREEAAEEYREAAGPELGSEDQTIQQICPGQRREAEHQQRRQLLRRWGSSRGAVLPIQVSERTVHSGLKNCQDHSWITETDPRPPQPIKPLT